MVKNARPIPLNWLELTASATDACSTVSPEAHEASIGSLGLLAEIAELTV